MTFGSKTDAACDCGSLDRAAREPQIPIEFDPHLNEFNLLYPTGGKMRIYHCPFCGGRAPESLRHTLFAHIPSIEADRLFRLTRDLKTVADVLEALGPPDRDGPNGVMTMVPERDGHPPSATARRTMVYDHLSDVAYVHVEVYGDQSVTFGLLGKPVGPDDGAA